MQIDKFATANVHFVNKDLLDLKWVDFHDLIAPQSLRITGEAIITIDVIDPVLREMLMNVRIIRDANNITNNAALADFDNTSDIESATLFYEPAPIHPPAQSPCDTSSPKRAITSASLPPTSRVSTTRCIRYFPFPSVLVKLMT